MWLLTEQKCFAQRSEESAVGGEEGRKEGVFLSLSILFLRSFKLPEKMASLKNVPSTSLSRHSCYNRRHLLQTQACVKRSRTEQWHLFSSRCHLDSNSVSTSPMERTRVRGSSSGPAVPCAPLRSVDRWFRSPGGSKTRKVEKISRYTVHVRPQRWRWKIYSEKYGYHVIKHGFLQDKLALLSKYDSLSYFLVKRARKPPQKHWNVAKRDLWRLLWSTCHVKMLPA